MLVSTRCCFAAILIAFAMPVGAAAPSVPLDPPITLTPFRSPDPLAHYVRARASVPLDGQAVAVELLIVGDEAALRARTLNGQVSLAAIDRIELALAVLADRTLQPLWAPLAQWAGPGLEGLRSRSIAARRQAFARAQPSPAATSNESTVRPKVRALLQFSRTMWSAGYRFEARQLLQNWLASNNPRGRRSWASIEWTSIVTEQGWQDRADENWDAALAHYRRIEDTLGRSPYAVNGSVNRAALLARLGRYQEALQLINAGQARFDNEAGRDALSGSERQFAWIRSCALAGLGRKQEADAAAAIVAQESVDPNFVVETATKLEERLADCRNDTAKLVELTHTRLEKQLVIEDLLYLQPAAKLRTMAAKRAAALRSDQALMAAMRKRMRVLPKEYEPALNGWQ